MAKVVRDSKGQCLKAEGIAARRREEFVAGFDGMVEGPIKAVALCTCTFLVPRKKKADDKKRAKLTRFPRHDGSIWAGSDSGNRSSLIGRQALREAQ